MQKHQSLTKNWILKTLKEVCLSAFGEKNYGVALKALDLLGREKGLFQKKIPEKNLKTLEDMTEDELKILLS